jgi:alpha-amylase
MQNLSVLNRRKEYMKAFALWFGMALAVWLAKAGVAGERFPRSHMNQADVFYEIFVRSFQDSDGDGIGDFNGIVQRLDYLQSLGVTALWLMPIHPSPSYHGYDVLDYYAVNPDYGTLTDFKRLLGEAHRREMRVIIDLVLNHSSSQHPLFQAALDPQSPYRDYYVWRETGPGQDGGSGHGWHKTDHGTYFGLFWSEMPDLNLTNPAVTAEMQNMARFWLNEVGVDGFRIDAIAHLIEEDGHHENTPATHAWLQEFYTFLKGVNANATVVGEVWEAGGALIKAYGGGREKLDQMFNFELAKGYLNSARGKDKASVVHALNVALAEAPHGNYATFLTNHDQDRAMSVLGGSVERAKVAAALLLTGPGTPYLYYGEEIGMTGRKPDEHIRTPMPWSPESGAGFTIGKPWIALNEDYTANNVAAQENDPDSLLHHYRKLIALRRETPALHGGNVKILETGHPAVYAILRQAGNQTALVLINLGSQTIRHYELSLKSGHLPDVRYSPQTVFGEGHAAELQVRAGSFSGYLPLPELKPYATHVLIINALTDREPTP